MAAQVQWDRYFQEAWDNSVPAYQRELSAQFKEATELAVRKALQERNDAIRYMARAIPIYRQYAPTPEQARAGGCVKCHYLGLWTAQWPGYENSQHGLIILFEEGIRFVRTDMWEQTYATLLHEFGHALQLDHILDAMEGERKRVQHQSRGATGG